MGASANIYYGMLTQRKGFSIKHVIPKLWLPHSSIMSRPYLSDGSGEEESHEKGGKLMNLN